jgi:hypothetical protein
MEYGAWSEKVTTATNLPCALRPEPCTLLYPEPCAFSLRYFSYFCRKFSP